MKRAIGVVSSLTPVENLRRKGFSLVELDSSESFRRFVAPIPVAGADLDGFELHVVEDEAAYAREFNLEHLAPRLVSAPETTAPVVHPNGVTSVGGVLELRTLKETPLGIHLRLRKQFPLAGLVLHAKELEAFEKAAHPDAKFSDAAVTSLIVHLGPSCFDLVIQNPPPRG